MNVSWLIGSVRFASAQEITTNAGNATVAAGTYYLRSSTGSESLIQALETALDDAGVTTPSVSVLENGTVQITAGANVSITWGAATDLRDALGFSGNLALGTEHNADGYSNIFWSPRYPCTPTTRVGIDAYEVPDVAQTISPTGQTVVATTHHTQLHQGLEWAFVRADQLQDGRPSSGGTFHRFLQDVIRNNQAFYHHDSIAENLNGSSAVSWGTGLGPYKVRDITRLNRWYQRRIANAEIGGPLRLELIKTEGA